MKMATFIRTAEKMYINLNKVILNTYRKASI